MEFKNISVQDEKNIKDHEVFLSGKSENFVLDILKKEGFKIEREKTKYNAVRFEDAEYGKFFVESFFIRSAKNGVVVNFFRKKKNRNKPGHIPVDSYKEIERIKVKTLQEIKKRYQTPGKELKTQIIRTQLNETYVNDRQEIKNLIGILCGEYDFKIQRKHKKKQILELTRFSLNFNKTELYHIGVKIQKVGEWFIISYVSGTKRSKQGKPFDSSVQPDNVSFKFVRQFNLEQNKETA